jgi:isoleucyl-tRNA synthetase
MEAYDIVEAYKALRDFLDHLNNWYIRLNRRRFWSSEESEQKTAAYQVLYTVLRQFSLVAAPFIPFTAEALYRGLCGEDTSVHLENWPAEQPQWKDPQLVDEVSAIQRVVYQGRRIRERHNIKIRQPLARMQVSGITQELLDAYREVIAGELNVKQIELMENAGELVRREFKLDRPKLGPKYGKRFAELLQASRAGEGELREDGRAVLCGVVLEPEEFSVDYSASNPESGCAAEGGTIVVLSLQVDRELLLEGIARDLVRATQELRKQAGLAYTDRICLSVSSESGEVKEALTAHGEWVQSETLATALLMTPMNGEALESRTVEVGSSQALVALAKAGQSA